MKRSDGSTATAKTELDAGHPYRIPGVMRNRAGSTQQQRISAHLQAYNAIIATMTRRDTHVIHNLPDPPVQHAGEGRCEVNVNDVVRERRRP